MPVRSLRLLLLTAALLLTQLGGLLHGLSHHAADQDRPHTACQLCAAYSAFDHAAVAKTIPPQAARIYSPPAPIAIQGIERRCLLPYHSRAPPLLLA